jgi:hypothetical protein
MAVFVGDSVVTDTEDLKNDNSLPNSGMLNLGSIGSDDAFGSVAGKDCMLVRGGDVLRSIIGGGQREQMDNDLDTHVKGNEKHTVDQNAKLIFLANLDLGVDKVYHVTVKATGALIEDINGPVTCNFLQPKMETFMAAYNAQHEESFWAKHNDWHVYFTTGSTVIVFEFELVATHLEIGGLHSELKVSHPEVKVFNAMSTTIQAETAASKAKVEAFQAEMGMGARLKAILNALTSFGLGTPFR